MMIRMLVAATALVASLAPLPSLAQNGSGMLVCERDLKEIQSYLDSNRSQLSEQAVRDADRRLEVAKTECSASPQQGSTTIAQLRRDLGMEVGSQTAQPPVRSPGYQ